MNTNDHSYDTLIPVPMLIDTERLILRPLRVEDATSYLEALNESREQLDQWMGWSKSQATIDAVEDYILRGNAKWILRTDLVYGIFTRELPDRVLGGTGFHQLNWSIRAFETGYWLRTSATGNGYMQEALRGLTTMAFSDLHARRIELRCDPANTRSIRVAEQCGYELEGRLRSADTNTNDEVVDDLVFARIAPGFDRGQT